MSEQRQTPKKRLAPKWEKAFLSSFRRSAVVKYACRAAKVGRTTVYQHRESCPEFAALWDAAHEEAMDTLEREAERRGAKGLVRKKFNGKGEPVIDPKTGEQYEEREYSDTLLIFLLKAGRPEKFRENVNLKHSGDKDSPILVSHEHAGRITIEEYRKLSLADRVRLLRAEVSLPLVN